MAEPHPAVPGASMHSSNPPAGHASVPPPRLRKRVQFAWGCVGALLVKALGWASIAASDSTTPFPDLGLGFVAGVFILIVVGGVWNVALEGHNVLLGIYHGGTAPLAVAFLCHLGVPEQRQHQAQDPATAGATATASSTDHLAAAPSEKAERDQLVPATKMDAPRVPKPRVVSVPPFDGGGFHLDASIAPVASTSGDAGGR